MSTAGFSVAVIYHADCPDGFGAALAARRHFGPDARLLPLHHGTDWRLLGLAGQAVYILDFSFPPDVLEEIAGSARSVVQIDHHATARAPWATHLVPDNNGQESFRHPTLPLTVIFDLDKSGCRLAWEHFFPTQALPLLLSHIEDIDLWRFALPGTRAFNRALRLLPWDFAVWETLLAETADADSPRYRQMLAEGEAIENFCRREVERLANSRLVMPCRVRGEAADELQAVRHGQAVITTDNQCWHTIEGLAINADSLFTSELGHALAESSGSFGLIWQLAADGEVKVSLRAAGKVNVGEIATRYGGGGHPNAAGFRLQSEQFLAEVLAMVPKKYLGHHD
jgi:oligoribonuclease NrnB/cAMP/cGMP phosphodiesterase (DHH superfamily)